MNWKLLALGKGFYEKIWRGVAVPESVQSCFELSIHFPVFFSRELFLEQFTAGSLTDKCMESLKHDWTLSGRATSLQFFS